MAGLAVGPPAANPPQRRPAVPAEQNKQVVRTFVEEILNRQRVNLVDELLASDYKLHFPGAPEPLSREAFPAFIAGFPAAFPDFRIAVESMIAEGDEVAVRFVLSGTHQGEFMGVPPTGRKVEVPGHVFYRLRGSKIVDDRPIFDRALLLEQLGVMQAR
jgi:steroid delta-isomerase-like uncharacterized protein